MRTTNLAYTLILSLAIAACSGVDIQHSPVDRFAAGNYHYYKWHTAPLPTVTRSSDPIYAIDPVLRKEVDAGLQQKGYVLDPTRAQFTVDYRYMTEMIDGERSALASNIDPQPRVIANRQINQAVVDNAIALGGVKQTNNIVLQFIDRASNQEVWQVMLSRIVDDANNVDTSRLSDNLQSHLERALEPLPAATGQ